MPNVPGNVRGSVAAILIIVSFAGCGSEDGDESGHDRSMPGAADGAASNGGSRTGAAGDDGRFGNPSGGAGTGLMPRADAGSSASPPADLSSDNACAEATLTAMLSPVRMLVMFDRSQSMDDNDKWPNATAALKSFFGNPSSAGLRIALRFFPHDDPAEGCTRDGCDPVACSQPLIAIGELTADSAPQDAHEGALTRAIDDSAPGNSEGQGTPIHAALDGALRWAISDHAMHPDEKTVVIFVTDGEPNGCDEDFDDISMLASDALAMSGISTYAIGLEGSNEDQMDQLAQAGGTQNGIFIGNSANAEQELLAALDAIRGQTLSCDFAVPEATSAGTTIDFDKVNVTFTSGAGVAGTLARVPDGTRCGGAKSWYYDDPMKPARIALCPGACELVQGDAAGKLEILLGCNTCGGLDVDCGDNPPTGLPPVL